MPESTHQRKLHHFNTPGHAHELTFSCYRRQPLLNDDIACEMLLDEIARSREIYNFKLWAYVLMPHHVHLLIWPLNHDYSIGKIESGIKGIMAKRFRKYLFETNVTKHDSLIVTAAGVKQFVFWQKGGGFDRNLWNSKAIHDSIGYIEANPVRSRFVAVPDDWPWSSARARVQKTGVVPDTFTMPVLMPNSHYQRLGAL